MRELYDIAEEIRKCTNCKLCRDRMLAVPGEGNGKIMIVGFTPGPEEDRLGTPFVGFDDSLKSAGLTREDCFLTYCIKCYSEKKEFPLTCKKWLDKQISVIEPKLIVLLGEDVLNFVLGDYDFDNVNGTVIEGKYFVCSEDDFSKLKEFVY